MAVGVCTYVNLFCHAVRTSSCSEQQARKHRVIVRELGPQNMETVTEKVAKATIPFLKAWNLSFPMVYDGHLTRVAVVSYYT